METRVCGNDASHVETRAIAKLTPAPQPSYGFPTGGTTKSEDTSGNDKTVQSSDTGDAGIALYGVLALAALSGMAGTGRRGKGKAE